MVPTIWVGFAVSICTAMPVQAELSHARTSVQAVARIVSRLSAIHHTSYRFTIKTGYSPLDGTKPWVKDRFPHGAKCPPTHQRHLSHPIRRLEADVRLNLIKVVRQSKAQAATVQRRQERQGGTRRVAIGRSAARR